MYPDGRKMRGEWWQYRDARDQLPRCVCVFLEGARGGREGQGGAEKVQRRVGRVLETARTVSCGFWNLHAGWYMQCR